MKEEKKFQDILKLLNNRKIFLFDKFVVKDLVTKESIREEFRSAIFEGAVHVWKRQ